MRVCLRCGAVLHAECWEDNGRCPTFGCPGEMAQAPDTGSLPPAAARVDLSELPELPSATDTANATTRLCPQCGMRIRAAAVKCRYCRAEVGSVQGAARARRRGFCWWGFLFGGLWYLARGMWRKGLVLIALAYATIGIVPAFVAGFCGYDDLARHEAGEVFWW